jgi:glycogen debranching enzyme
LRAGQSEGARTFRGFAIDTLLLALLFVSVPSLAQAPQDRARAKLRDARLELSSVDTRRFVAVHGRRSVVMGYPQTGLEIWAYPFQVLSGYRIGFRPDGAATETDGRLLLRRIIEKPDSVVRIYAGPDYVVREKLFVPLDQAAAVLSYEVQAQRPIVIDIHFTPVLNLMWPGAMGGQSTSWNANLPGYLLEQPTHALRAAVASPDIVLHDDTVNSTLHPEGNLGFSIEPRPSHGANPDAPAVANVFVEFLESPDEDPAAAIRALEDQAPQLEADATAHYDELAQHALRVSTPDDDVNSALAWSEVALDQAWVCNPQLGCATVGGYGPSRNGRRPQYAWFFAGDGLVAVNALVSTGEYARARDELLFIAKYQDPSSGMVWHELSQSAGYIDWSKYPYMFVHVDISFDYLNTVARYISASGDTAFASTHWSSIGAAYRYCYSLLGPDGLPHIPAGKEGIDEQHRPAEDLGLSVSWVGATQSFAALARATGHLQLAEEALQENRRARQAVAAHFWDAKNHYWIDGYTAQGAPIFTRRSSPAEAIEEGIFSPEQNEQLLDQIASLRFQTDWGTRSVATDSSIYAPWSYATGSVFALNAEQTASMFWDEHRPDIAWSIWRSIVPWNTLDSLGHLHEVLAGNYYREQTESVPEQTWSSSGLLDAAVRGLLGIDIDGAQNSVTFRPHLPAEWDHISVANVHLPHSTLAFAMHQDIDSIDLEVTNDGAPVRLRFEPEIPLGARIIGARFGAHPVSTSIQRFAEDEHADMQLEIPSGVSRCHLQFAGGVSLILPRYIPRIGDASIALKLTKAALQGKTLSIETDIRATAENSFDIRTPWRIAAATGATVQALSDHRYRIAIQNPEQNGPEYLPAKVEISFAEQ